MEIKAFVEDSDHAEKRLCEIHFAEQILTDHLLVEYLSIVASIKLKINYFNISN